MTATHTTAEPITGETYLRMHPDAIDIGRNARISNILPLDPEFLESVRTHGVITPVTATRLADGAIVLRDGQRRTLAAREVGLTSVPVLVREDTTDDEKTREFERIAHQVVANVSEELTEGDKAAAIVDMLDLGFSATKVSGALTVDRKVVKKAAVAGRSESGRKALDEQLSLDQAVVIAEFEADGDEEAVSELLSIDPDRFDYAASVRRIQTDERKAREAVEAEYTRQGFIVVTEHMLEELEDWAWHVGTKLVESGEQPSIDEIRARAEHWGVLLTSTDGWAHTETGERLHRDQLAWNTRWRRDAVAEPGEVHFNDVEQRTFWEPQYVCLDLGAAGVQMLYDPKEAADEEAERASNERRKVRELNLRAEAAAVVRKEFLGKLACAKTPPKAAARYVATIHAVDASLLSEYRAGDLIPELLKVDSLGRSSAVADLIAKSSEARAQVITLTMVLAAQEGRMAKDSWRTPRANTDRYLAFLAAHGYHLSSVEEVMAGTRDIDTVDLD